MSAVVGSLLGSVQYGRPGSAGGAPRPRLARPGLGGQLASLTARHDEITAGAGPLRAIAVRLQVTLPALRTLLAPGALAKTHQHTVTRDRAGVTMPARSRQP